MTRHKPAVKPAEGNDDKGSPPSSKPATKPERGKRTEAESPLKRPPNLVEDLPTEASIDDNKPVQDMVD